MQYYKGGSIYLLFLCTALLLAILLPGGHYQGTQYEIFTPYEYPIVPGMPEWEQISPGGMSDACTVPGALIESMSTQALVKTFVTNPMAGNMFAYDSYHGGFLKVKEIYHTGLKELMEREDLPQAVLAVYQEYEIYKGKIPEELPSQVLLDTYEKQIEERRQMDLLEALAAEMEDSHLTIELVNAITDKYEEREANPRIYGGIPHQYNRTFDRMWNERIYAMLWPGERPPYPVVTN